MLLPILLSLYVLLVGLAAGSYLNVVIYRLPRDVSTVWPASRCPSCQSRIRPWDNIPLLSFLLLRGRCRSCGAPIAWRYPLVESATGLLFIGSFLRFGVSWEAVIAALFGCLMVVLALIDLEHFILPDRITLPGIAAGLLLQPLIGWTTWTSALLGTLLGAGLLLLLNGLWWLVRRVQGFGLGDVKMLAMIGAFLGVRGVLITLFIGAMAGSVMGLLLLIKGRLRLRSKMPFGFFLALGGLSALFFGADLVHWYFGFYP